MRERPKKVHQRLMTRTGFPFDLHLLASCACGLPGLGRKIACLPSAFDDTQHDSRAGLGGSQFVKLRSTTPGWICGLTD